jgi:hypothetical protein
MSENQNNMGAYFSWLVSEEGARAFIPEEKPNASQRIERRAKRDHLLDFADQIRKILRQYHGESMGPTDLLQGELPDHFKCVLGFSTPEEQAQLGLMEASKALCCPPRDLAEIYSYQYAQDIDCPKSPIREKDMVEIFKDLYQEAWERAREINGDKRFRETKISKYYALTYPMPQN